MHEVYILHNRILFSRKRNSLTLIFGCVKATFLLVGLSQGSFGQSITVADAATNSEVTDYVQNVLLGSCVTASNITFTGTPHAAGTFDGNGTTLGLNGGIVLTTGESVRALGPDAFNSAGFGNGTAGDPDLTDLANNFTTYDAAILEFDFVPQSDTIRFNYIFGSEEYPEYVGSPFNDVFGFFLSGPGISGPYSGGAENIALIPGTTDAVAINNLNNGYSATEPPSGPCNNCAYYVDNSSGPAVEYDGHTVVLTAQAVVVPCQTYHIKIAIADAGDGALDSGVFLEEGSFSAVGGDPVELVAAQGVSGVEEGCDVGSFVFRRLTGPSNTASLTVGYNVSGTATPGVDYTALPGSITIPAGEDSVVLNIEGVLDFTPEGNESVVLTLAGGGCSCSAPPSVSMDIVDNDIQLSLATTGTTTICLGQTANLTATGSGSITPYSGSWDNGASAGANVAVSPTQTTTYTYTLTDACGGQTLTSSETVSVITSGLSVDDTTQCFQGNAFSFVNEGATGGTVSHYWEFGDGNDSNSENLVYSYGAAGVYTVTHSVIHLASGCTTSTSLPIEVYQEPSVLVLLNQQVTCSGGSDGELGTSIFGGQSSFEYLWTPNGETTAGISGLSVGFYTVNVTDANGCTDAVTANMTQSDPDLPTALCQDVSVYLNQAGTATISATQVDNGSSDNCGIASLVVSPNAFTCAQLGLNNVVLEVTDVNTNVSTCGATVLVEDTVSPMAVCQDLSVALDGSGNASVSATQIDNGSTDNCAIQSIGVLPSSFDCSHVGDNLVTLTVLDIAGNTSTCNATVTVSETGDPTAVCQNITVQLDATGNVSITGSQVGGASIDNCGVASIDATPTDFTCADIGDNNVTVTATDGSGNTNNCASVVTVEDNLPPTANCQNISVQLDASGTFNVDAQDVDLGSADNCSVASVTVTPSVFDCSNLGVESVTLTVSDTEGNESTCTSMVTVSDTIPPTAVCQDQTIQLDGSGSATVTAAQVDNGSSDVCGIASLTIDNDSFTCSEIGQNQVTLTVVDNNGNSSSCAAIVMVEETTPPTALCQNQAVFLDGTGAATIQGVQIDNGSFDNCAIDTMFVSPQNLDCSNLGQTGILLTVTDESGNMSSCSSMVETLDTIAPQILNCPSNIQISSNSSNCASAVNWVEPTTTDNCGATLTVDQTNGSTFPLGNTTVTYTATDLSGNTTQCSFEVSIDADPIAILLTPIEYACGFHISCNGLLDGEVTAIVSGGCEPYTFLWSDGQIGSTANGLGAGEQILTVTDGTGTQFSDTIVLMEPEELETDILSSEKYEGEVNVSCAGAIDGSIDFEVLGGAACNDYSYIWSGPNGFVSNQRSPENLEAGQFWVTVMDANGCSYSDTIILTEPDSIVVNAFPNSYNGFGVSCFGGNDGRIDLETTGGIPGYQYQWSHGDFAEDVDSLIAGVYTVTVVDTNGCEGMLSVTLNQPTPISISVVDSVPVSCNGANTGQVQVLGSGGLPNYTYEWSNGDADAVLSGVSAGSYQVVVSDINGCQDSLSVTLNEPDVLSVSVQQITATTCFNANDGAAEILASGGTGDYGYIWQPSLDNTPVVIGLSGGSQIYTVTDENGCSVTDTLVVPEPDQVSIITSNDTTVCPGSFVPLFAEVTGGGGTYLINWEQGQAFGNTYEAFYTQTSNVSVTAVDQNGCEAVPNSVIVTALQPVQADFDYQVLNPCSAPFQVDFSNGSSNATAYEWIFENGDSSQLLLPTTAFDTTGTFSVSLIATSDEGCTDTLHSTISVDHLPVANFNIPNPEGCFPIMVGHYNLSTHSNSFFWDFGDGTTSDDVPAFHLYENPGAYTVSLIASNDNGCSDTLSVDSAVVVFPRPVASFTPISTGSEEGNEFFMNNTTTGATDYFWLFGGSDFSDLFEPTHSFPEFGGYDIILTASNEFGCEDTALVSVNVELNYGLFVPNAMAVGEPGLSGRFQPIGTGLANYHVWVFDLWGNQLWESTQLNNGSPAEAWDGRYNGKLVPQGAYSWKINAEFKNGLVWDGMDKPGVKPSSVGSVTVLY